MFLLLFCALLVRNMALPYDPAFYDVHKSVIYKEVGPRPLRLDLYVPNGGLTDCPVIVFVHGGAWFVGYRGDYEDYACALATEGIAVALIEFRLTPPEGFFDQVADIKDAIRWVRSHAEEYGINPDGIGLYGSSSGGHLAALVADSDGTPDDPPGESCAVAAAMYVHGVYDMAQPGGAIPWARLVVAVMFDGSRADPCEAARAASPVCLVEGDEPPTLILHGAEDKWIPIEQVRRYANALRAAGVPTDLVVFENQGHGFVKVAPWLRPIIFNMLVDFFTEMLPPAKQLAAF